MTNGFNASVPARKPKTRIGRVLMEMTSDPEVDATEADASRASEDEAAQTPHAGGRSDDNGTGQALENAVDDDVAAASALHAPPRPTPHPRAGAEQPSAHRQAEHVGQTSAVSAADAPAPRPAPSAGSSVAASRDRLAALRERLALATQPPPARSEPKHTAVAVRELIEQLRGRVEAVASERAEIAAELEDTRAALAKAESELERERRSRADVEARAEERQRVADEAVSEAESLASERDLVLAELAAQRQLEDEQSALLAEAETALDRQRADRDAAAREVAETRNLLDLRAAEIVELESRLEAELAKRAKVEARCSELEAEITRLAEARDALETIQGMVGHRR